MDQLLPATAPTTDVAEDTELVRLYDYPAGLDRPWVKVNFVSSADGAVAVDGRSGGLSDPNDKRVFALGRTLADVVLVGAGTALAEGYRGVKAAEVRARIRAELGLAPVPPIAVVTRSASVPPAAPLVTDVQVPTMVFTVAAAPQERRAALAEAGAEVILAGETEVDPHAVLAELDRRGLRRVCCEGGPQLFGTLIAAELVDELCLSLAPLLAGGTAGRIATGPTPAAPTRLTLASVLHADNLLLLRYLRGDR